VTTITVDQKTYQVDPSRNLLDVCLSLGLNLPYFCWHPALGSVGACRQCAVKQFKDANDTRGKLVMACMTPATDGTIISIEDAEAVEFRASITEWLMVNHPHDCPICDEGGECHLQDMTVMTGHNYRRYRFNKRTYRNQYLGPFVNHEMNRCIQCYRCVRFYRDYAGGRDLDVFAAHDDVYFGRSEDGVLENEFSGNLVEVCPTGVFTDKSLKQHYTRKWDLQTAPSVCVNCGLGCNTIPGERYGQLRRIRNRYNYDVNGYFLCDRGRYGYEFVNDERHLRHSFLRADRNLDEAQAAAGSEALQQIAEWLKTGAKPIGLGSPRASLEANYALWKLVGPDRFFSGLADTDQHLITTALDILQHSPARSPSLHEVEQAGAILILGEDVTNTAPMLALALRQSVHRQPEQTVEQLKIPLWNDAATREVIRDQPGPLFIATVNTTKLDSVATQTYRAAPADMARLGFAIAHAIDLTAPAVRDLSDELKRLVDQIAAALKAAKHPLIISGVTSGSEAVLHAAANVAWAMCADRHPAELSLVVPECNSVGLGLMSDRNLQEAFEMVQAGEADTLIVLENDLYRRAAPETIDRLCAAAKHIVAIDHLANLAASKADVVLPAATFAEGDGTFVNNEGRAQRFFQVFVPEGDLQESWRWLRDIMLAAGRTEVEQWCTLDNVTEALAADWPIFAPVPQLTPRADFRIADAKIPREPHRYSGRTSMRANISVHEPKPPDDPDSALAFSMEGFKGQPPAPLIAHYWAPGWNSVQSLNKFQAEVAGPLVGGPMGQRLIEAAADQQRSYFQEIPAAFEPRQNEWLIVPLYHIFGSEELSVLSLGVKERSPVPYLALNSEDAQSLQVAAESKVKVTIGQTTIELPIKVECALPRGVAGLPIGLADMPKMAVPKWATLAVEEIERT
jgi:NADH-quinone oxidoreductase subunit G